MNAKRIFYLLRNEWIVKWKIYALIAGVAVLFSILNFMNEGQLITTFTPESFRSSGLNTGIIYGGTLQFTSFQDLYGSQVFHLDYFPFLLKVLAVVVTAYSFWEYRNQNSSTFHIALPAETFEKWLAKFINVVLLFPLIFLLAYRVFSMYTSYVMASRGEEIVHLSLLDPYVWKCLFSSFILQLFIFTLAVIFRSFSVVKIGLSLLVLYFTTNVVTNTMMSLLDKENIELKWGEVIFSPTVYLKSQMASINMSVDPSVLNISTGIVILFCLGCLVFSYFRFVEIEA